MGLNEKFYTLKQSKVTNFMADKLGMKNNLEEGINLDEEIEKVKEQILMLQREIEELDEQERREEEEIIRQKMEISHINIDELIEGEISVEEKLEIKEEHPKENILDLIKKGVIKAFNNKTIKSVKEKRKETILEKVKRRIKKDLLVLLVVANWEVTTTFIYPDSDAVIAYNKIKIDDLKDWESIVLDQDQINKMENISIINEAHKDSDKKYIVVDKSAGFSHLYQSDDLVSTYEVGVGENEGDEQTKTIVDKKSRKIYWEEGNKKTGAGIYTINKKGWYKHSPSFTMLNERGIEVPMAFHETSKSRKKFFGDQVKENNRMSNGCLNYKAESLYDLGKQKGVGTGTPVYVLPDDPHNKFQIVDGGELRFLSNQVDVNRTIRPYVAQPILLRAEGINNKGKEFLQSLVNSKKDLMALYPTVSNDVYNQLAKTAYGIFGQESSFGTYGKGIGQIGRIGDRIGEKLGKNVSAGVTQIRITAINKKVKDVFDIYKTQDLFHIKKSAIATMALLLDIYTNNIPNNRKEEYEELVPLFYNSPNECKVNIQSGKKVNSLYVQNVQSYAKKVTVYLNNY